MSKMNTTKFISQYTEQEFLDYGRKIVKEADEKLAALQEQLEKLTTVVPVNPTQAWKYRTGAAILKKNDKKDEEISSIKKQMVDIFEDVKQMRLIITESEELPRAMREAVLIEKRNAENFSSYYVTGPARKYTGFN